MKEIRKIDKRKKDIRKPTIPEMIRKYREQGNWTIEEFGTWLCLLREKTGWTQDELAEKVGVSRETIVKRENGERYLKNEDIITLASVLGVDCHYLLTGQNLANLTVSSELGLSDNAIQFLKDIQNTDDKLVPVGDFAYVSPDEIDATSPDKDFTGRVGSVEAVYPSEMRDIVDLLLSTPAGRNLLSLLYKYVATDFNNGAVRVLKDGQEDDVKIADEVAFYSVRGNEHKVVIPLDTLRYSIGQAILNVLDDMRESESKEILISSSTIQSISIPKDLKKLGESES